MKQKVSFFVILAAISVLSGCSKKDPMPEPYNGVWYVKNCTGEQLRLQVYGWKVYDGDEYEALFLDREIAPGDSTRITSQYMSHEPAFQCLCEHLSILSVDIIDHQSQLCQQWTYALNGLPDGHFFSSTGWREFRRTKSGGEQAYCWTFDILPEDIE